MTEKTNTITLSDRVKDIAKDFGLPRLIITGFLVLLLVVSPFVGADLPTQISNIINRFSWNGILVLAMVPMVHSGCGLNFGLPLGIISGLLGATLSIELGFTGAFSFLMAILLATPFALVFGCIYGWLLNKINQFFRNLLQLHRSYPENYRLIHPDALQHHIFDDRHVPSH